MAEQQAALPEIGPRPATPRGGLPYVWVTWLPRILAGDRQCVWAAWFKARFRHNKIEDPNFDKVKYSADHTRLLQGVAFDLQHKGYQCRIENENKFNVKGRHAILSGKPDIIAFKQNEVVIVDAKSGSQQHSDAWQVMIYLFAVPIAFKHDVEGRTVKGLVAYRPQNEGEGPRYVEVTLSEDRRADILKMMHAVGSEGSEPEKHPSQSECGYCDIGRQDCDKRIGEGAGIDILTSEF